MTTPANPTNESDPMTFAELHTALKTSGPVYDPLLGKIMDPAHVRYDAVTALCNRRLDLFADALRLNHIETIPWLEQLSFVNDAVHRGIISDSTAVDLTGASAYFYGVRAEDGAPVYILAEADFIIRKAHVKMAISKASGMEIILRAKGPPEQSGIALPVVAGGQLYTDRDGFTEPLWKATFVQI